MLKQIIVLLLLATSVVANAQNEPKKRWDPNNPLQWSDFTGAIDQSSKYSAQIYCGNNYNYNWTQRDGKYTFKFEVMGNMTPSRSWTIIEKQTPELLRHEQLHFDIAEFFARQLQKAFDSYAYTNDFDNEIARIKADNDKERELMQKVYDNQTDHSKNKEIQAKWDTYVGDLLSHNYAMEAALIKEPSVNR